jgi:hypothetical protein
MVRIVVVTSLLALISADPKPFWPKKFFANFTETFPPTSATGSGYYALDLSYRSTPTSPYQGAQAIYRTNTDGYGDTTCGSFHNNTPCVQLAVNGERYLHFPELTECCTCCSWKDGCGPISQGWTSNAVYAGQKKVNGVMCDDFSIQGGQTNHLLQTLDASKLCEVDNTDTDHIVFDIPTFNETVNPLYFQIPDYGCSKSCGAKGECH